MRVIFLFLLTFLPTYLYAECDFISANHIDGLSNPKSIKNIEIEIPKSSNYSKNFLRIILTDSRNINPSFKKKFKANITVNYIFGTCEYKGWVKQLGDWRDHITFNDKGEQTRSLNVKLFDGNILNNVRFKLFLPETRHNLNEVFGANLLKNLGFISPETFQVNTIINEVKSIMLFQEHANKELLEKNNRREGPLFEGDESLLWSYKDYELFDLVDLALSRVINPSWFLKGDNSQLITLKSYEQLQNAYLEYSQSIGFYEYSHAIFPNKKENIIFQDYYFINYAMRGEHGLAAHNRQYYYNSFLRIFEPIYYDGDFELLRGFNKKITYSLNLVFQKGYKFKYSNLIKDKSFKDKLYKNYSLRVINEKKSKKFFDKAYEKLLKNIEDIQDHIDRINFQEELKRKPKAGKRFDKMTTLEMIQSYNKTQKKLELQQQSVFFNKKTKNRYQLMDGQNNFYDLSIKELAEIISRNKYQNKRFVYLPGKKLKNEFSDENFDKFEKELEGRILKSRGSSYSIDKKNKILKIKQEKFSDWFLIVNANLSDWKIVFEGKKINELIKKTPQRFNEYGLTGCLNIYNSIFKNTDVFVKAGMCEDSLNVISSKGNLNSIEIIDSYSDAIDMDFSNIKINFIFVKNAGNDCFDISSGSYEFLNSNLINCKDKGISVGEKSTLSVGNLKIDDTDIGVSSKDSSITKINRAKILNTNICAEAKQKKQEFGGAKLSFDNLECSGEFLIDAKSIMTK